MGVGEWARVRLWVATMGSGLVGELVVGGVWVWFVGGSMGVYVWWWE